MNNVLDQDQLSKRNFLFKYYIFGFPNPPCISHNSVCRTLIGIIHFALETLEHLLWPLILQDFLDVKSKT